MKRWFQMLSLAMVIYAPLTFAQWHNLYEDKSVVTYTNKDAIVRMDIFVNVAELLDYKQRRRNDEGEIFQSAVIKAQYNCRDNRVRVYTIDFYAERMAKGNIIHNRKVYNNWQDINPRSVEQNLKDFACGKKKSPG